MKRKIANVAASVRSKLQNKAKETNRPFAEVLQYYAMERFLYRLSKSEFRGRFILKGALLFTVWQVPNRRATLDIDFLGRFENKISAIRHMVQIICKTNVPPNGLRFDPETVVCEKIKEGADYEGVRTTFRGFLEKSRIPMQIDIGFGDVIFPGVQDIDYPGILDFPKPRLKGYPIETVIAEKFESMVQLGLLNSWMKDFYDLWLIIRQFDFERKNLAEAIRRTFTHRKTKLPDGVPLFADEIYDEKSDRQTLWKAFLTKGKIENAPFQLKEVAKVIEDFLAVPIRMIQKL